MKSLFRGIAVLLTVAVFSLTSGAQTHPKTYPTLKSVNQGQFIDFGGYFNGTVPVAKDSLGVTDTARYIIPVTHENDIHHYLTLYWNKIGAGTATLLLKFYQSNDGNTYFDIKKGAANTNYTKSLTLSASATNEISFARDTAKFEGRFLKVELITSSTANVKGKYVARLKTTIK